MIVFLYLCFSTADGLSANEWLFANRGFTSCIVTLLKFQIATGDLCKYLVILTTPIFHYKFDKKLLFGLVLLVDLLYLFLEGYLIRMKDLPYLFQLGTKAFNGCLILGILILKVLFIDIHI